MTAGAEPGRDKLLARIGALLDKAERTDSPAEAHALAEKAQRLATLHAIDPEAAVARRRDGHRPEQPEQREVGIGPAGKAANRHLVALYCAVAHANAVIVNVARNSSYVIGFGFPTDLDVVQAVYASLAHQMVSAANAAIDAGRHREDVYWSAQAGRWRSDARVFRRSFYEGFTDEVAHRLRRARDAAADEADAGRGQPGGGDDAGGAQLVLARRHDEVAAFHRRTSTARGTWRGNRSRGQPVGSQGRRDGRRAGRQAQLTTPKGLGGPGGQLDQG